MFVRSFAFQILAAKVPRYFRESGMAKRNSNKPQEHGRTGWRSRNCKEQFIVSPVCPRRITVVILIFTTMGLVGAGTEHPWPIYIRLFSTGGYPDIRSAHRLRALHACELPLHQRFRHVPRRLPGRPQTSSLPRATHRRSRPRHLPRWINLADRPIGLRCVLLSFSAEIRRHPWLGCCPWIASSRRWLFW